MHDSTTTIRLRPRATAVGTARAAAPGTLEGNRGRNPTAIGFKQRVPRKLAEAASTLLLLGIIVLLWPASLGGDVSYVVVSGSSMEPGLHTGDLVLVREQDTYEPGDVVAFRIPDGDMGAGTQVIHRITGGDGSTGYTTQGDNKNGDDPWSPTDADVVGKRWLLVPGGGNVATSLHTPLGFAAMVGGGVFLAVATSKPKAGRTRTGSRRPAQS